MKSTLFSVSMLGFISIFFLSGCVFKSVRQQDLNAWQGVSVQELDKHSLFLTLPVVKTITEDGVEIRVYSNKLELSSCSGGGSITKSSHFNRSDLSNYLDCTSRLVGCDNIFYIKDKKVVQYKPVGRCYTDETVQPEKRNW